MLLKLALLVVLVYNELRPPRGFVAAALDVAARSACLGRLSRAPFEEDKHKRHEMVEELVMKRVMQVLDSPAQRTLRGEDPAVVYSKDELQKHMHLLAMRSEESNFRSGACPRQEVPSRPKG